MRVIYVKGTLKKERNAKICHKALPIPARARTAGRNG